MKRDPYSNPAKVIVCGLPGSGNFLVAAHLVRCGIQVAVDYGDDRLRFEQRMITHPDGLVIPFRHHEAGRIRGAKLRVDWTRAQEIDSREVVCHGMSLLPYWHVCYESLIQSALGNIDSIVAALGHVHVPQPDPLGVLTGNYGRGPMAKIFGKRLRTVKADMTIDRPAVIR